MRYIRTLLAISLVFAAGCTKCSQSSEPHPDPAMDAPMPAEEPMINENTQESLPPSDTLDQELPPEEQLPDNPADEDLAE